VHGEGYEKDTKNYYKGLKRRSLRNEGSTFRGGSRIILKGSSQERVEAGERIVGGDEVKAGLGAGGIYLSREGGRNSRSRWGIRKKDFQQGKKIASIRLQMWGLSRTRKE